MSTTSFTKSFGFLVIFSVFAWFSDVLSGGIAVLQSQSASFIGTPHGAVITATSGVLVGLLEVAGVDAVDKALVALGLYFGIQFFLSLITLCIFYSIVLASPKGTFTFIHCLSALGIFIVESIPFLCGIPSWGWFAVILRRRSASSSGS